MDLGCTLDLG